LKSEFGPMFVRVVTVSPFEIRQEEFTAEYAKHAE
jgi:hypothetical protein